MPDVDDPESRPPPPESAGELREALERCRRALRLEPGERDPDLRDSALHLRIAGLHARLDRPEDAREAYRRAERSARGEGRPLGQEPCVEVARLLGEAGHTGSALDLLRTAWETRTGERRPAGRIEGAACRLDPGADLSEWTPRWPERGEDARGAAPGAPRPGANRPVLAPGTDAGAGDGAPGGAGGAEPAGDGPGSEGDGGERARPAPRRRPGGEAAGRAAPPEEPPVPGEAASRPTTGDVSRHFARSYPDRVAHALGEAPPSRASRPVRLRPPQTGGEEDAGDGAGPPAAPPEEAPAPSASGPLPGPAPPLPTEPEGGPPAGPDAGREMPPATPRPPTGPDEGDARAGLRRGLQVVDEMLELAPDDLRLLGRRVAYARRLEDREALADSLVRMADALRREASLRGAHLLLDTVLHRVDPGREEAAALLRRVRGEWEAAGRPAAPPGDGGAGAPRQEGIRAELTRALDEIPRELEHLYRAIRHANAGGPGDGASSWRARGRFGRYLLARGRPREAVPHLEAARAGAPQETEEHLDLLYLTGLAHLRAGRPGEAGSRFRRLAGRDDGFATARGVLEG